MASDLRPPNDYALLDTIYDRLFPLMRSITGDGIEQSLAIMAEAMPLDIFGVPSGTQVFDWETPPQWNCRSACLTGPDGAVVCDMAQSNLHVVNYSEGVDRHLTLEELQPHLHSLPHLPDAVPYVTSYYNRTWGFCLSHTQRLALKPGTYRVHIDADFSTGRVPLAHTFLDGDSRREILIPSYLCHPSLANNELSGPLVLLGLYHRLKAWPRRRHRFRFVLNPETIGSLCYLHLYGDDLMANVDAGLVLTCLGGPGNLTYKTSRRETATVDRLADHWQARGEAIRLRPFTPTGGSDERQYCAPGFNLPVGQFARCAYGEYDGYHNSLDTKAFMTIDALVRSIDEIEAFLQELDMVGPWVNQSPFGEPQLGRRGLYPNINSAATWGASSDEVFDGRKILERILTVLNYSDGGRDLVAIAGKANCTVRDLLPVVTRLEQGGLLKSILET
jgi:aminopeptidase-like protein